MAEQFLPDDGNVLSFPDTSWLGDAGVEAQIGRDSYGVDEFLIYSSDNPPYPLKADHFQPELPFPFRNTGPEVLDRAADKEISYWGPLEMPSSIPSSLNPSLVSTSLENRDFDMTEMSVLSQPVLMLADAEPPKACSPRCLDRLDISTSTILPVVGSRPLLVSACQQSSIMESHLPNITLKRKRSSERVTADGPNSNLIDRESALKLCVKHIPDPTIGVIESVAKDFGFSFEFVMDLCCRYRKNRNSSSLNFAKLENAQRSSSVYGESEKLAFSTEDASRRGITIGEPTVTTPPTKRPKLSIEIQKENGKALQTKSDRCHVCGQTFSRHPDLLRHQKSHSPAQIHCPYPGCMKSFTRKDKFNEHWRRRHSGDMSQTNLIQDGEDEHRRDPDPGGSQGSGNSFGPGGPGQGGTSFQKSQNGEASANQSLPSYGSSSGTSFNLEIDLVESFYPAFANQAVNDYVRKFAAAKVIRKLGRGGFGSVYEVFVDSGLDATHCNVFACKTLSLPRRGRQEITERAKNEINILQLLDHPHIIKFSGALILRDRIFINSQPLADSDLKVFLAEQSLPIPTLTKSQIWEGARGLASALAYVHDYGKGNGYHGDLKPENILVIREAKPSPSIKFLLADFGSAWISNSTSIINPHNRAGTPRYCAPEYFTSQSAIGPFSDVWSLGCVFAVIVTFLHDQTMGDFECFQQCNMEPEEKWTYTERLPALKVWLQFLSLYRRQFAFPIIQLEHMNLIQKMLLPDPEDRPSATKVIRRLKAIENSTMDSVDECNQQSDWTSKQPSSVTSLSGSSLLNNKRRRRSKLEPPTKLILHVLSWGFRASDQALKEKCWEWTDEKSLKMWCISFLHDLRILPYLDRSGSYHSNLRTCNLQVEPRDEFSALRLALSRPRDLEILQRDNNETYSLESHERLIDRVLEKSTEMGLWVLLMNTDRITRSRNRTKQGSDSDIYQYQPLRHNNLTLGIPVLQTSSVVENIRMGRTRRRYTQIEREQAEKVRKSGACIECRCRKVRCPHILWKTNDSHAITRSVREKSSPETRALGLVTICPNTMCPRMMCSNPERGACAPLLTEVTLEAPLYGKSRVSLDDIYEIVRRPWVLSKYPPKYYIQGMLLNHRLFHGYQGESTGTFKNYLSAARCSDQLLVTCTDGLCIDQDDSQERRGQLSPMETVYSEANEVSISTDQKITYIPNTSPMKLASRHHPMLYLSGSQPEECLLSRKAHL